MSILISNTSAVEREVFTIIFGPVYNVELKIYKRTHSADAQNTNGRPDILSMNIHRMFWPCVQSRYARWENDQTSDRGKIIR